VELSPKKGGVKAETLQCQLLNTGASIIWAGKNLTILVVLCLYLEVRLRMIAHGANLGCLLANDDVAAVSALPDNVAVL
jgi:hypothetical protein